MDDADVVVTFTSEAARIDLNFAPKEMLAGLFAGLGANKDAAMDDADRIVGWRTRPRPAAPMTRKRSMPAAGLNYPPRQSLFTHVNELALVVGLPPALVDRALPFVTVFNGSSDVDATIAAPEVLAACPKTDSDKPKDALGGRHRRSPSDPTAATRATRPGCDRNGRKAPATGSRRRSISATAAALRVGSRDRARRQVGTLPRAVLAG